MSKPRSYEYTGTKGHIVEIILSLPQTGQELLNRGWIDISHEHAAKAGHYTYKEESTGLQVKFDRAKAGAPGFEGKNHYHIMNPETTGDENAYLDINGNPVRRGSNASHILPKGV